MPSLSYYSDSHIGKEIANMRFSKKLFPTISDQRIIDAINIRNIRNMFVFALVVCMVEVISLILYVIFNRNAPEFTRTLFSVSYCVTVCGIVAVFSWVIIRKYNRENMISNIQSNALVIFFYVLMSAWSIYVDAAHYGAGNQMLTFFIVQFCFVSFVVMSPRSGSILIALAFIALYVALCFQDGESRVKSTSSTRGYD